MKPDSKPRAAQEKIGADLKLKPRKSAPAVSYQTEDQLKEETRRRMEEQRLIEAARKPKSERVKKADNFFYHYKNVVIAVAAALFMVAFFIKDVVFQVKPDFTVITVGNRYLSSESQEAMGEWLSGLTEDINGDGKRLVRVDFIQIHDVVAAQQAASSAPPADASSAPEMSEIPGVGGNVEMEYANAMKLMAVVASNADPIFLMDESGYAYLMRAGEGEEEPDPQDAVFYPMAEHGGGNEYALPVDGLNLPEELKAFRGMSFYLRNWEGHKKNGDLFRAGQEMLGRIVAGK